MRDQIRKHNSPNNSTTLTGASAPVMLMQGGAEHSKLLPWLMLTAVLAGIALGVSSMDALHNTENEARMRAEQDRSEAHTRAELDKQNRFNQELRIRVEDAEIAAEEVNPKFHPRRTE